MPRALRETCHLRVFKNVSSTKSPQAPKDEARATSGIRNFLMIRDGLDFLN